MKTALLIAISDITKQVYYQLEFVNKKPTNGRYPSSYIRINKVAASVLLKNAELSLDYAVPGARRYIITKIK